MKVMGLDLSTKAGWSVVEDMKLVAYGLVEHKPDGGPISDTYPYNYIDASRMLAMKLLSVIVTNQPDIIVIEETNKGKNRYSQKLLEFIHYSVCSSLRDHFSHIPITYMDTSEWRKRVSIQFNKSELTAKKDLSTIKNQTREELKTELWSFFNDSYQRELFQLGAKKRPQKKLFKTYSMIINDMVTEAMSHKTIKKDGKRLTHISKKHVSVRRVNEIFGTSFEVKDNDICDSICLCVGYYNRIGDRNEQKHGS
jgi:hypothetical protein